MQAASLSTDNIEKSLVDWKNPPSLSNLKQDLTEAKSSHGAQVTKINTWLDNLYVEGKAKIKPTGDRSSIVPKLIRKQAEWRYAALSEPFLSTDDVFNVYPVTYADRKSAQQNQLVLNNQFNTKLKKIAFIDKYVRSAVNTGTVIIKLGWLYEDEEVEVEVEVPQYAVVPNPAAPGGLEQVQVGVTTQTETQTRIIKNQPTVEICNYNNVLIDPTCGDDLSKANFIIHSFESNKATLEKDGRYKNLDKINVDANSILGTPDHAATNEDTKSFNFSDEPRKKLVVFEYWGYWDIDGSGIVKPFLASWIGDTLVRLEESPFPDKELPFVVVPYLPVDGSCYGEPDGALLEDNQKVIGAVTRGMIDIMGRSANGQIGIRKDALDVTNKRKFEQGKDYEFNPNVDPRQAILTHTYPEIPASAQFMLQLQNMEAESLSGVKAFSSGISSQSLGDVAIGVRSALDAASKRELGILRRLSDGLIQIGRKIIAMNAEFLSDQEVIRITDEEFVEVQRDDLPGNFDLRLTISTAEEDNNKAQELAFMLQTMGNNMDAEMSKMILSDIARLRKMPDLAKRIESFQPQPDPVAKKMQELQLAELEHDILEKKAKIRKLQMEAELTVAKIGTEEAKSGDIRSTADLKNLDYVEQESGVKQARDLEKQGAQAHAQMLTKVAEHKMRMKEKPQNSKSK